jgi:hypothetical protein
MSDKLSDNFQDYEELYKFIHTNVVPSIGSDFRPKLIGVSRILYFCQKDAGAIYDINKFNKAVIKSMLDKYKTVSNQDIYFSNCGFKDFYVENSQELIDEVLREKAAEVDAPNRYEIKVGILNNMNKLRKLNGLEEVPFKRGSTFQLQEITSSDNGENRTSWGRFTL